MADVDGDGDGDTDVDVFVLMLMMMAMMMAMAMALTVVMVLLADFSCAIVSKKVCHRGNGNDKANEMWCGSDFCLAIILRGFVVWRL